jgi:PAS domain S-box-containing protein
MGNAVKTKQYPVKKSSRSSTSMPLGAEELKQSLKRLEALIYEAPIGICHTDLTGKFTYANKRFEKVSGFSREEVVGKSGFKLGMFSSQTLKLLRERIKDRLMGKPSHLLEIQFKCKDGYWIWVSMEGRLMREGGIPVGFQLISRDITEQKRAEEALRESEERSRSIVENSHEGIIILDDAYRCTYVNDELCRMSRYSREEIVGQDFRKFLDEESEQLVADRYLRRQRGEEVPPRYEFNIVRKDGQKRRVEISSSVIKDSAGRVKTVSQILDITERKQSEEQIRQAAEEWRATFDSVTDLVSILDKDFKLVRVNKAFADTFKMKPKELLGKTCYEMMHGTNDPPPDCPHQKTLLTKRPATLEFFEPNLGIHLEASTSPLFNKKGELAGSVHVARDITERKQAEQQLIMTDRLASIGELASGIAHELNNPLTSVIGFSQLLLGRDIPDDMKEDLSLVNSEAQRAASVVKNLLTFARKHAAVKQLSQINNIIEDVLRLRAYEQKVNNIEVERRFAPNLPEMMVDYFQMQQVFLNIIINAEYFMIQAHNRGTLTITTERLDSIIRISFADDGPGISKENLRRLFNPFFTTKDVGQGTGLGLSICHGIVTEHGGKIYATSKLGEGATFVVELSIDAHWRARSAT